jgi:hypothetical protein
MNGVNELRETIRVVRGSLVVFGLGVASFVPVLGLLCALVALGLWIAARRWRAVWNPAQRYLDWGARLAVAAILFTVVVGGLLVWANARVASSS